MPSQEALVIFEFGEQQLRLAGATKVCPECGGEGWIYSAAEMRCRGCNPKGDSPTQGRAYVFPDETGVRVACQGYHSVSLPGQTWDIAICVEVGCRGWTAATNLAVWLQFVYRWHIISGKVDIGVCIGDEEWDWELIGEEFTSNLKFAAITALTRTVEAHEGWELMEEADAGPK